MIVAAGLNDGVHPGDRAFHVDPLGTGALNVAIKDVTIRKAKTSLLLNVSPAGAGILNGPAALGQANPVGSAVLLDDVIVKDNTAARTGGGIANLGAMAIQNSTIDGNKASDAGGGIFQGDVGSLDMVDSVVKNNAATTAAAAG